MASTTVSVVMILTIWCFAQGDASTWTSKCSSSHLAFASACLVAMCQLVAARSLDFEQELCGGYCVCIYMYVHKRYVGDSGICLFYIASVRVTVLLLLAFSSVRLVALHRLVAEWALDFEQELCSIQSL